jgi:hypothetical protein
MDPEHRQEASELGKRAGRQSKHALRNAGKAAQVAAQPVLEEVEDTVEGVVKTAKRVSPIGISRLSGDTAVGFMAVSVALFAGHLAFNKFRGVYTGRSLVIKSTPKMSVPPPAA